MDGKQRMGPAGWHRRGGRLDVGARTGPGSRPGAGPRPAVLGRAGIGATGPHAISGTRALARPALLLGILVALLAACTAGGSASPLGPGGSASPSTVGSPGAATPSPSPIPLTVGLGYIPSVQFAQFYLADQRGYYRDAGLDVTFENKIDPDLIRLTGQGAVDISLADGTSLIPAVSQGIPVEYVATIYAKFPNVVFAKASSGITSAADLKGRTIGTPGRYGSGWIMLQALLDSVGLTVDDVSVVEYPTYGQLAGVEQGAVDAATGFANNEPVLLALAGETPVVLHVDSAVALPGNGLIVGTAAAQDKAAAVRAFVAATLRAMQDVIDDPSAGLDATFAAVPELASDRAAQEAVLAATIDGWQSALTETQGLGAIDTAGWQASIDFMKSLPGDLVPNPVTVDQLVTTDFLPQ
jgi:NitT/TauT family transport system substrate-binding protein